MAVVAASLMTLRPGAYEAFLEQHKKVKPLLESAGARNIRLWARRGARRRGCCAGGELRVR